MKSEDFVFFHDIPLFWIYNGQRLGNYIVIIIELYSLFAISTVNHQLGAWKKLLYHLLVLLFFGQITYFHRLYQSCELFSHVTSFFY